MLVLLSFPRGPPCPTSHNLLLMPSNPPSTLLVGQTPCHHHTPTFFHSFIRPPRRSSSEYLGLGIHSTKTCCSYFLPLSTLQLLQVSEHKSHSVSCFCGGFLIYRPASVICHHAYIPFHHPYPCSCLMSVLSSFPSFFSMSPPLIQTLSPSISPSLSSHYPYLGFFPVNGPSAVYPQWTMSRP